MFRFSFHLSANVFCSVRLQLIYAHAVYMYIKMPCQINCHPIWQIGCCSSLLHVVIHIHNSKTLRCINCNINIWINSFWTHSWNNEWYTLINSRMCCLHSNCANHSHKVNGEKQTNSGNKPFNSCSYMVLWMLSLVHNKIIEQWVSWASLKKVFFHQSNLFLMSVFLTVWLVRYWLTLMMQRWNRNRVYFSVTVILAMLRTCWLQLDIVSRL